MPAYLARIELQCSTQLLVEIFCPHHSGRSPSERGFNASRKQPAAFHTPDVLLTDGGDIPEEPPDGGTLPVSAGGVGPAFALVVGVPDGSDVGWVTTGTFTLVVVGVSLAVVEVVAGDGPETGFGATAAPPAQFAGLVARPGPAWIGLQPGSWDNGPFRPISSLTLDFFLHASLAGPSWIEPAPKQLGEFRA